MRFHISKMIVGCLAFLLVASGCSLVDDEETLAGADPTEKTVHSVEEDGDPAAGKADHTESSTSEATCFEQDDCSKLPNTVSWCSPGGTCRYSCELGYGSADGEAHENGCECKLSNAGREVCDGIDNDCDGVIDNRFAEGRVAAGSRRTCAVDAAGAVRCWGEQALEGAPRSGMEAFWEVGAGSHHSCALTKVGDAYCWGNNDDGQVGPHAGRHAEEPVRVTDELRFLDIAAGVDHSCGLTYDSEVYCWGGNDYGQLGDGTDDDRTEPTLVASSVQDFVDVTAGDFHTCAARTTGEVLCWGANVLGQSGQKPLDDLLEPTEVDAPEALIFVEAGANHTCGLTGEGVAYCWGNNSYGQLGDETRHTTHEPKKVHAGVGFLALSAGNTHTCAIAEGGRLFCWGSDVDGRLGTEEDGASSLPREVRSELAFSDVAAGEAHTCALSRDGHLYCWGDGRHGQLVPGQPSTASVPTRVDCR